MPNGTRRGHVVRRNGKTFYRSATRIKPPSQKALAGIGLIGGGFLVAAGAPPAVVTIVGVAALGGWFAYKNRRPLRTMRRAARSSYRAVDRWAQRQHKARTGKPAPKYTPVGQRAVGWAERHQSARTGRPATPKPREDGAYLDANLRPHYSDGQFMPDSEWERGPRREPVLEDPTTWKTAGQPATSKQRYTMQQAKIAWREGMTKGEASKLLSEFNKALQ